MDPTARCPFLMSPPEIIFSIVEKNGGIFWTLRKTCKAMHVLLPPLHTCKDWVVEKAMPTLGAYYLDIRSEIDPLCDAFRVLSLSDRQSKLSDLEIHFPTTRNGIPVALLEQIFSHYRPKILILSCKNTCPALRLDLVTTGVEIIDSISQQRFHLASCKKMWLKGAWLANITLSDSLKKIAKEETIYAWDGAEWEQRIVHIDFTAGECHRQ